MAAISLSAPTFLCLSSDRSYTFASSSSSSPTKLSSLRFRFPAKFQGIRIGSKGVSCPSKPHFRFLVEAKKQTFSNLDELLVNSDKPVLVDFYATWCGPCQFMVPILDEVSTRLKDTIRVVKIDTEKYPSIANQYSIEALPTFIIFKDGKPFARFEGALTADQLVERIENTLNVKK